MSKGKFGVSLSVFGILAFIVTFFDMYVVLFLLLGYAILAEKNQWLTRNVLMAVFVRVLFSVIDVIVEAGRRVLVAFFGLFNSLFASNAISFFNGAANFVNAIFTVLLLAFCIYAIFAIIKGKDVKCPLLNKWADQSVEAME